MSKATDDVLAERQRQINEKGWTAEHDDEHDGGELCAAGGCYALYADAYPNAGEPPVAWPWHQKWWKPKDFRQDLVRAAALVIAEIERLDRAAPMTTDVHSEPTRCTCLEFHPDYCQIHAA